MNRNPRETIDPSYGAPVSSNMDLMEYVGRREQRLYDILGELPEAVGRLNEVSARINALEWALGGRRSFRHDPTLEAVYNERRDILREIRHLREERADCKEDLERYERLINRSHQSSFGMEFGLEPGTSIGDLQKSFTITALVVSERQAEQDSNRLPIPQLQRTANSPLAHERPAKEYLFAYS